MSRLDDLKDKLKARRNVRGFKENAKEIEAEIARLEKEQAK